MPSCLRPDHTRCSNCGVDTRSQEHNFPYGQSPRLRPFDTQIAASDPACSRHRHISENRNRSPLYRRGHNGPAHRAFPRNRSPPLPHMPLDCPYIPLWSCRNRSPSDKSASHHTTVCRPHPHIVTPGHTGSHPNIGPLDSHNFRSNSESQTCRSRRRPGTSHVPRRKPQRRVGSDPRRPASPTSEEDTHSLWDIPTPGNRPGNTAHRRRNWSPPRNPKAPDTSPTLRMSPTTNTSTRQDTCTAGCPNRSDIPIAKLPSRPTSNRIASFAPKPRPQNLATPVREATRT